MPYARQATAEGTTAHVQRAPMSLDCRHRGQPQQQATRDSQRQDDFPSGQCHLSNFLPCGSHASTECGAPAIAQQQQQQRHCAPTWSMLSKLARRLGSRWYSSEPASSSTFGYSMLARMRLCASALRVATPCSTQLSSGRPTSSSFFTCARQDEGRTATAGHDAHADRGAAKARACPHTAAGKAAQPLGSLAGKHHCPSCLQCPLQCC